MEVVRHRGDKEWSALYVDGKLAVVGDHYHADEKIAELLGVIEVQSDDFLRGGTHYEDVANTLEELGAYRAERLRRESEAESLRAQARALIEQAKALEAAAH